MKLIVTFVVICLTLATLKHNDLPFVTFTNASLDIWDKTVRGSSNYKSSALQLDNAFITSQSPHHITNIKKINGDLLIITDDSVGMVVHYFHFMEHLLGIWNFLTYKNPANVKMILFNFAQSSTMDQAWHGTNNITLQLLTLLFPNATIGLLKDLPADLRLEAPNIFISSRVLSHLNPISYYINMNGGARQYYKPSRLKNMRDQLLYNMQVKITLPPTHLRITYSKRTNRRKMDEKIEKNLITNIEQITNIPVNVVDFATLTFKDQLQIIANTDLLIGAHGNGLTHLVFLPDNATLLEFYSVPNTSFYRVFAQLRGLRYYGNYKDKWYSKYIQSLTNDNQGYDVTEIDLKRTLDLVKRLNREHANNAKIW